MERLVTKGPLSEAWRATFPKCGPRTQQQFGLLYDFGAGLTAGGVMMLMAGVPAQARVFTVVVLLLW